MSTLLGVTTIEREIKISAVEYNRCHHNNNYYYRTILKPKNIFKSKCKKLLKRKLKKYKLRRDGIEDPDIIDVSETFLSALTIKSPIKHRINLNSPDKNISDSEEIRPKNYLFKMARRRQKLKPANTNDTKSVQNTDIACDSPIKESLDKNQTNAFKLIMDSRNKSIGTNSPGKKKTTDYFEIQEIIEKRNNKVKRNLALQKMAEAKGSLKKKEMEKHEEEYINKKMEQRAVKLKKLIGKKTIKFDEEHKGSIQSLKSDKIEIPDTSEDIMKPIKCENKIPNNLQVINIFSEVLKSPMKICSDIKNISKEDEEFLKKLSPSIKKKENMHSYFKKLDKKSESLSPTESGPSNAVEANVIRVKIAVENNKTLKKKKLSLSKEPFSEVLKNRDENNCHKAVKNIDNSTDISNSSDRRKRKRKANTTDVDKLAIVDIVEMKEEIEIRRPKRNVKRPVKYIDDVQLSSSDEELHIFTPKKRKHIKGTASHTTRDVTNHIVLSDDEPKKEGTCPPKEISKPKKKIEKEIKVQKKPTKLAPIFAAKTQLNPAEIEAKQKFLYSGIPDQLKKIMTQQKNASVELNNDFPVVVHIQQKIASTDISTPIQCLLDVLDTDGDEIANQKIMFKELLSSSNAERTVSAVPILKHSIHTVLQSIKESYPKFPVYRTYRLLRGRRKGEFRDFKYPNFDSSVEVVSDMTETINENPDNLNWTDRYKAATANQLIGNFESIKELRKWLISWTENDDKRKNGKSDSDSSDFYESDPDSRDSMKSMKNLLILTGPVGSGKTSSVYAIATELSMKVIEVNCSSKRSGKLMLQDLQEATQSHKINRCNGSTDYSQKSQDSIDSLTPNITKKRGRPKKSSEKLIKTTMSVEKNEKLSQQSSSQEIVRTAMSLILIDDADIVFEQDDGFSSAIAQLIQYSKRPVILVTTSLCCPHLQRFSQCGNIIQMHRLSPRMLGTWLDIMCLADSGLCWPGLGAKLLDIFNGDIRKTINSLQFYVTSQAQESATEETDKDLKYNNDDENSSTSWADNEGFQERNTDLNIHFSPKNEGYKALMDKIIASNLRHYQCPLNLINVWWSIPNLLNEVSDCTNSRDLKRSCREMEVIASMLDILSVSDYLNSNKPDTKSNITSQPWISFENDSVSEYENLDNFKRSYEFNNEIIHHLTSATIMETQRILKSENDINIHFPGMAAQR